MMIFLITSVTDVDFAGLVAGSLPRMDAGTYVWPEGVGTAQQKEDYLRVRAGAIFAQPNALCFKCVIDGEDVAAVFGTVNGTVFNGGFSLVRPDRNGSRAFVYRQDVLDSQKQFFALHDVTTLRAAVPVTSPLAPGLDVRHSVSDTQVPGHGSNYRGVEIDFS